MNSSAVFPFLRNRLLTMVRGIKFRIMIRVYLLVTLLIAVIGISSYCILSYITMKRALDEASARTEKLCTQLEHSFDDIYRFSEFLVVSPDVGRFLVNYKFRSEFERVYATNSLTQYLRNIMFLRQTIHSVAVIDQRGRAYWTMSPFDDYFQQVLEREGLKDMMSSDRPFCSRKYSIPLNFNMKSSVDVISYVLTIRPVGEEIVKGRIVCNINLENLFKDLPAYAREYDDLIIINEYGQILYAKKTGFVLPSLDYNESSVSISHVGKFYYFSRALSNIKWHVIGTINVPGITTDIEHSIVFLLFLPLLLCLLLPTVLILPILYQTIRQIVTLNNGMKAVAFGDLSARVQLRGAQEFDELADAFGKMTVSLKMHIEESLENLRARQRVAFDLLLAQINPHFIYNTLNSVIYLARKERSEDIIKMVDAFIGLLQDGVNLGEGGIFAEIAGEIDVIRRYVTIQEYKYAGRFDFQADVDERLLNVKIPRSMIQVLVENAIVHGICPKAGPGKICLRVFAPDDDRVAISVEDDGVGIEPEVIERILHRSGDDREASPPTKFRSIGIRNILSELEFLYGNAHTFDIASGLGRGTTVTIVLPRTTSAAEISDADVLRQS
jgi:two-component system, sensor histidine kinase YesM